MKNLVYLVICSIILISCNSKIQQKSIDQLETPILKSKRMGYFQATGINSDWSLEISEEKIQFTSTAIEMLTPHVEPVRAMDANVKIYRVMAEKGELNISIYQKKCEVENSNKDFTYEVKITVNSNNQLSEFLGCGNYNADYRLYDIWVLEELENKKVNLSNFTQEIPSIEINSSSKSISGYAGCNRISGILFQERELLRFINLVSTRMACPDGNLEQSFLKALQASTRYEIKNNRLFLSNPSGMKLVFKKVD